MAYLSVPSPGKWILDIFWKNVLTFFSTIFFLAAQLVFLWTFSWSAACALKLFSQIAQSKSMVFAKKQAQSRDLIRVSVRVTNTRALRGVVQRRWEEGLETVQAQFSHFSSI